MSSLVERSLGCVGGAVRFLSFAKHIFTQKGRPRMCLGWSCVMLGAGSELTREFFFFFSIVELYNNININKQLMVAPGGR